MLTDNGAVFTGLPRRGGRVALEIELGRLGIRFDHSRAYHPQTQGKVERFQQTEKKWLAAQPPAKTIAGLHRQLSRFRRYYNEVRPHRAIARRTPWEAYTARPKATATGPYIDPHCRVRHDRVDKAGTVTLRHNSRLHHIGIGRRLAGTRITLLVDDLHIRIIDRDTGELLRELTLDPTRDFQPRGLPPGPPPKQALKCNDVPRHLSTVSRDITTVGLTGFEPATSSSRTRRATKLRHSPMRTGWYVAEAGPQPAQPYPSLGGLSQSVQAVRGPSRGPSRGQREQGGLGSAGDADAGVRAGADARRDVQPGAARIAVARVRRVTVQALGASVVEVAVGRQRAHEGKADLAAVGVPGDHDVVAFGGELVEHPQVRRVGVGDPDVGAEVRRPGDQVEPVVAQVRVVDTDERERGVADLELVTAIGESSQPAST